MTNNAKEDLYARVDLMRKNLGISPYNTAINTLELCERKISDVEIVYHAFETSGFCGAALAGDKENTIVLNIARTQNEQIFDCGHELIHLVRHRHLNSTASRPPAALLSSPSVKFSRKPWNHNGSGVFLCSEV